MINNGKAPAANEGLSEDISDFSPIGQNESSKIILSRGWQEPIPFDEPQETLGDPFPTDALPERLCGAVLAMSRIIKAPIVLCVQSVMAVANLAAQRLFDVQIDGRRYPCSLYFLSIALSGERKSGCDTAATVPLVDRETRLRIEYDILIRQNVDERETYEAERRAILNKRSMGQHEKTAALKLIEQPPDKPAPPILKVTDATIEGIQNAFAAGCPALGLFNDEGGTVLGGWAFKEENELRAAAALSSLWDGKSVTRVRGGDGTKVLTGRRLCTHLQIQPVVARRVLGNGLLQGQGLLARFLVAYPPSTQGGRTYNPEELAETDGMTKFNERIGELIKQKLPLSPGKLDELAPTVLMVEGEAKQLWIQFYNAVEADLKPSGQFEPIRGLANKMPEHVLRLAATFVAVEGDGILPEVMGNAIEVGNWYLNEALRLSAPVNQLAETQEAQSLWQFIGKQNWDSFTTRQVYQLGPAFARSASKAKRLLKLLESHCLIRTSGDEWEVNPYA